MMILKKLKNKLSLIKYNITYFIQRKFVYSKYATIKRLAKLNNLNLWKIFLEKNYGSLRKENVNKWLPYYLVQHSKLIANKYGVYPDNIIDRTFISACNIAYNCEALNIIPVDVIEDDSCLASYLGFDEKDSKFRIFSKFIFDLVDYKVTASIPNRDDFTIYNIDIDQQVFRAIENEIINLINSEFIRFVMQLGVSNAKQQYDVQDINLNLNFGPDKVTLKDFSIPSFIDKDNHDLKNVWDAEISNFDVKDVYEQQKRISARILAVSNLISMLNRTGRPTIMITNSAVMTLLQDSAQLVLNNVDFDLCNQNLYKAGSFIGIDIYVDPNMEWNDTRICIGYIDNNSNISSIRLFLNKIMTGLKIKETDNDKIISYENDIKYKFEMLDPNSYFNWYTFAINFDEKYNAF